MLFTTDIDLSKNEFLTLRDFIYQKSGLFFKENKLYLVKNRLARRMQTLNCKSFDEYYLRLRYDTNREEFNALMNVLTTNETSFFRNQPQLDAFTKQILPNVIKNRMGQKKLRIWSAGCSTGEEPYTLGMILAENIPNFQQWDIQILGTDINTQVLQRAREGVYGLHTLRNTPKLSISKYFSKKDEKSYVISDEIKKIVQFQYLNLVDFSKMRIHRDMDIIFCRNVLIYFGESARKDVIRSYYMSLRPKGYLFIGHSETLHGVSKAFQLVHLGGILVYQKP